jgi:hypothetical protein
LLPGGILRAVLRRRSVLGGILRAAVLWCSGVRLRPTKVDRGRGPSSVPSPKMDPGGSSGGAFGPQTTREAIADDLLHTVHSTHADHESDRGGDKALDEDRALPQGRQAREPAYSHPHTANEVLPKIGAPPQPVHAAGEVLKVGPEADPPVMIMAVSAAPSMVPATPNVEVKKAATVEASPAATTCGALTLTYQLPSPRFKSQTRTEWTRKAQAVALPDG